MHHLPTRIVLLGDASFGKTAIVHQMIFQECPKTIPTIAASSFIYRTKNNQEIQVWDTAGAERFRSLNSVYYHNASGAILVFDLTNRQSFDSLQTWISEFTTYAKPGALLIIVGNKSDLDHYQVTVDEARRFAEEQDLHYFTTSAVTGKNIQEMAEFMADSLLDPQNAIISESSGHSIDIAKNSQKETGNNCC